jgi:hypothetical protein
MTRGEAVSTGAGYTSTGDHLLLDESLRVYQPTMVRLLGAHKAMALHQLHWLLSLPNSGREHDGHHWIYKSCEELGDEVGLTTDQAKRAMKSLRDDHGLVISIENPVQRWDRILWHRIDRDRVARLCAMHGVDMHHAQGESAPSNEQPCPNDVVRLRSRQRKSAAAIPETTPIDHELKKTSHTTTNKTPESAHDSLSLRPGQRGKVRRLKRPDHPSANEAASSTAGHDSGTAETPLERMEARKRQGPEDRLAALRERAKEKRRAA